MLNLTKDYTQNTKGSNQSAIWTIKPKLEILNGKFKIFFAVLCGDEERARAETREAANQNMLRLINGQEVRARAALQERVVQIKEAAKEAVVQYRRVHVVDRAKAAVYRRRAA